MNRSECQKRKFLRIRGQRNTSPDVTEVPLHATKHNARAVLRARSHHLATTWLEAPSVLEAAPLAIATWLHLRLKSRAELA